MGLHRFASRFGAGALIAVALGGAVLRVNGQDARPGPPRFASGDARLAARGAQVFRMVERPGPLPTGQLRANDEREKGGAAGDVFARFAPAVVFILAEDGSGTGFLIDAEGRLLTNHHVVTMPALDDETGARRVQVHLGVLDPKDSMMKVIKEGVPALIYKEDPVKDLALLKLTSTPPEVKSLTRIALAPAAPSLTDECISIGHPSGGALWTVRVGHVTATARWPGERLHETVAVLRAGGNMGKEIEEAFRSAPGRRVVLSDCLTGAGDSGGPLLDTAGRLIGVTFGGPARARDVQLSYHIHLDEVRAFLADIPSRPLLYEPDPWSEAVFAKPYDLDADGTLDSVVLWSDPREPLVALLVDLGQRGRLDKSELTSDLDRMKREWHPSFALTFVGGRPDRAFYDSDDDQTIDLVLSTPSVPAGANKADEERSAAIRRDGERWRKAGQRAGGLLDASLIPDREKRTRLVNVIQRLAKGDMEGKGAGDKK